MKIKTLTAAAAATLALIGTLAHADDTPLTRAQVNADYAAAKANHTLHRSDYYLGTPTSTQPSTVTRAQVQAELVAAQANGTLQRADDDAYPQLIAAKSTRTRADVKAEVRQAIADGTLPRSDDEYEHQAAFSNAPVNGARNLSGSFAQHSKADKAQGGS